jgi:CDP-glucose 4,6-dehydratase
MKNKILVTGGLGILGNQLIELLSQDKKNQVFLLDYKKNINRLKKTTFADKVTFIGGDFIDLNKMKHLILRHNFKTIFHLGAVTQVIDAYKSPMKTFRTNIDGTINILEAIRLINKKILFIYASSDKAYGELTGKSYKENHQLKGIYPYDVSKSASDLVAQSYSKTYGLKVGIIRCGNIYGPADYNLDRLIPGIIINTLKNKKIVIRSSGKLIRDYIYVYDAAKAYIMLMKKMLKNSKKLFIYNIGSKHNLTALIMLDKIQKLMKKKIIPLIKNNSKIEIKKQKLNYQKALKELKWKPNANLEKSLIETITWYKKNLSYFK